MKCALCKAKLDDWQLELKERRINAEIEEKHLGLVVIMTWDAHGRWHELGLELGIESSVLDALRTKHKESAEACFAEMISLWLKSEEKSVCKRLIEALRSSAVDLKNVAESVEKSKCT